MRVSLDTLTSLPSYSFYIDIFGEFIADGKRRNTAFYTEFVLVVP